MSLEIISPRERVEYFEIELAYWDPTLEYNGEDYYNSWCGFPCDETGKVVPQTPEGKPCSEDECSYWKNYLKCKADPKLKHKISRTKHSYIEPAHARCICGAEILLEDQYMGACECPECGNWYNLWGDRLKNPTEWEDDWY